MLIDSVMILVLLCYPSYHLQMPLRQRLTIIGVFLLRGFVTAAGIACVVLKSQGIKDDEHRSCEYYYTRKMIYKV